MGRGHLASLCTLCLAFLETQNCSGEQSLSIQSDQLSVHAAATLFDLGVPCAPRSAKGVWVVSSYPPPLTLILSLVQSRAHHG